MMYTVQTLGNLKCSILLTELFGNLIKIFEFLLIFWYNTVSIATCYGIDNLGIESQGRGEIFHTLADQPWGPPSLLQMVLVLSQC